MRAGMERLYRFNDALQRALSFILAVLFAAFICVVFLQVIGRNLLRLVPLMWTIDVALLLFLWSVFLGAAVAIRAGGHYMVEIIPEHHIRVIAAMLIVADVLVGVAVYIFAVYGIYFLDKAFTRQSIALGISEGWFYLAIPTAAILMVPFLLEMAIRHVREFRVLFASRFRRAGED